MSPAPLDQLLGRLLRRSLGALRAPQTLTGARPASAAPPRLGGLVVIPPAAPFAASAYARARLLRQCHAAGLCAEAAGASQAGTLRAAQRTQHPELRAAAC